MKIKHIYSILVRHCSAKFFWTMTFFLKENLSCVGAMLQMRLYCSNKNCKENQSASECHCIYMPTTLFV